MGNARELQLRPLGSNYIKNPNKPAKPPRDTGRRHFFSTSCSFHLKEAAPWIGFPLLFGAVAMAMNEPLCRCVHVLILLGRKADPINIGFHSHAVCLLLWKLFTSLPCSNNRHNKQNAEWVIWAALIIGSLSSVGLPPLATGRLCGQTV